VFDVDFLVELVQEPQVPFLMSETRSLHSRVCRRMMALVNNHHLEIGDIVRVLESRQAFRDP
jgi:hypothetical protein